MAFVRMLHNFIFSPESHDLLACFLKTVTRLSYDICTCTSVAILLHCEFANIRGDRFATLARTVARQSCNGFANIFGKKIRIKFLNMSRD